MTELEAAVLEAALEMIDLWHETKELKPADVSPEVRMRTRAAYRKLWAAAHAYRSAS